jgi:hypothetical protein
MAMCNHKTHHFYLSFLYVYGELISIWELKNVFQYRYGDLR